LKAEIFVYDDGGPRRVCLCGNGLAFSEINAKRFLADDPLDPCRQCGADRCGMSYGGEDDIQQVRCLICQHFGQIAIGRQAGDFRFVDVAVT
jgi:hypothetical protein